MNGSSIEQIKNRLDIVEVISGYIKLTKAGANYKALCPFHSEKTPSFTVSRSRQIWYCFGACQEGGDIIKFVQKIEGVEFGDALRMLADKAGIILRKESPQLRTKRSQLYDLNERACKYFEKCLEVKKDVFDYLKKRGLNNKTIEKFRLGYAPQKTKILVPGLRMFRDRIMFPICDLNGRINGFTGRVIPASAQGYVGRRKREGEGKYINSPDSLLFKKSIILYGLDKAKTEIRKKDLCILVEGNMDVIASHQAGIKNVVACSGTALTEDQIRIIKRYTDNLAICFDMDLAGEKATKRSIDLAIEQGLNIRVIILKDKDPAECIKKSKQSWHRAIKRAQPIIDWYFTNTFSKYDWQKIDDKKEIGQILLPIIKKIPNKIEQAHWLQELAKGLNVEEKILVDEISRNQKGVAERNSALRGETLPGYFKDQKLPKKSRLGQLEQRLASLIFKYPKFKKNVTKKFLKEFASQKDLLIFKIEQEKIEDPDKEIKACLKELKLIELREELKRVSQNIKEAEKKKDKKDLKKLTEKFNQISMVLKDYL